MAILNGTNGDDTLTDDSGSNILYGLDGNDTLYGMLGLDTLYGGNGNDILDGGGGADTMAGGAGNDTYYVDNVGDVVIENANEGIDTVITSVAYTLGANVENAIAGSSATFTITGNALDNTLTTIANQSINATLAGGLGNDTYYVGSQWNGRVIENVGAGVDTVYFTYDNGGTTYGQEIENIYLINRAYWGAGNVGDNLLVANPEFNTLISANSAWNYSNLSGFAGNDTYLVYHSDDSVIEGGHYYQAPGGGAVNPVAQQDFGGNDTVMSYASYTLNFMKEQTLYPFQASSNLYAYGLATGSIRCSERYNVENLQLMGTANIDGTGNEQNNNLTGNSGNNVLDGMAGDDVIDGGSGDDYLVGGTGNDTLIGGYGNDVLDGGTGTDIMMGGAGDDVYFVDSLSDIVVEYANKGYDIVYSTLSDYTLSANVEELRLIANGGVINGNAGNNTITGGIGADTLNGLDGNDILNGGAGNDILNGGNGNDTLDGGAGNDQMAGGLGDDTYIVNSWNDVVVEYADEGTDSIYSSVTYHLSDSFFGDTYVENLYLSGSDNINGFGNDLDNIISGNSGINLLAGGAGNDYYIVQNTDDVIVENADWMEAMTQTWVYYGIDTVESSVTYALNGYQSTALENLILTGTDNINGTGNALSNVLTGNSGNNILNGGYAGNDTLIGGAGNDILIGNGGDGTPDANNGNDILDGGTGNDLLQGLNGNDSYVNFIGNFGADVIDDSGNYTGGADTLDLSNYNSSAVLSWQALDLGGDGFVDSLFMNFGNSNSITIKNYFNNVSANDDASSAGTGYIENILFSNGNLNLAAVKGLATGATAIGNAGNDNLIGGAGADTMTGLDGNDRMYGRGGNDTLIGGNGNDILNGCSGDNHMIGGDGNDLYIVNSANDTILENAGEGEDYVEAWVSYTLSENLERLQLKGAANTNGTGNGGDNQLKGNIGDNVLDGGNGNDMLMGMAGNDTLVGGNGNDYLDGGTGNDLLQGGAGDDIYFHFNGAFGNDTISDASGRDLLNLKNYNTGDVLSWQALDTNADTFMDSLRMDFGGGNTITVENYFDNLSTDAGLSEAGSGYMEGILFGDASLRLDDVQALVA